MTKLSLYIRHGISSLNNVRKIALQSFNNPFEATRFIQELAWRDFWKHVLSRHPDWLWNNIEPYKIGFSSKDNSAKLPYDIKNGQTHIIGFAMSFFMVTCVKSI